MIIKVCGMSNAPENKSVLEHPQIDMIGIIQYPESKRFFPRKLETNKILVGVFVNSTLEEVISKVEAFDLKGVQLHGEEDAQFCRQLPKELVKIKTISIQNPTDFAQTNDFAEVVDFFLFDTKTPQFGGSGIQFDWNLLQHYDRETPFLLSGGIGPSDVLAIQNIKHPQFAGIDLNSCFELEAGKKDSLLLETFINELS